MIGCNRHTSDVVRTVWKSMLVLGLALSIGLVPTVTHTFQLDPYSTLDAETGKFVRTGAVSKIFPDFLPIHERLTLQAVSAAKIDGGYKTDAFVTGLIKGDVPPC